jgi:phosphate transport system substrate-binding protein
LALAILTVACGGSDTPAASTDTTVGGSSATTVKEAALSGTLNGSGSTFMKGFVEVSIAGYKKVQPGVTVNYAGGGSGTGRTNLQDGVVDYAGSDGLIADADKPKYKGGDVLYVPTVAAPITVSYNLADVKDLTLDADTIAKIFQRQIKKWDDAAIAGLNPGVKLPSTDIAVAHRSDGSGTTEQFTKYLVAAAPNTWTLKSGSTVEWPADTQAGNGNAGVAQIVKSTVGAVGYVDLSDAKASGLQFAKVKNKTGKAIVANLAGATAALSGTQLNPDLTYNQLNADGADAYPITSPTWMLVYKNQTDKAKGEALKGYLNFLLTDGQALNESVNFAKLPTAYRTKAIAQLNSIVIPS